MILNQLFSSCCFCWLVTSFDIIYSRYYSMYYRLTCQKRVVVNQFMKVSWKFHESFMKWFHLVPTLNTTYFYNFAFCWWSFSPCSLKINKLCYNMYHSFIVCVCVCVCVCFCSLLVCIFFLSVKYNYNIMSEL
jgi:hypothetical protein